MSSVYRSEHAPRYHNEPHIRALTWNRESIGYLLSKKLERLTPELFMTPTGGRRTIQDWLGAEWLHNVERGEIEEITDYLLRHTRLIPRDIVSLGNDLCNEVLVHKRRERADVPEEAIRRVVSQAACRFGNAQLRQCANQVSADTMPERAADHGYSHVYTTENGYSAGVERDIRDLIRMIGVDRFDNATLHVLRFCANERFNNATDLPSVLWQNGLLGYEDGEGVRFYSLSDLGDFTLPDDVESYVFHPIVIDSARIKGLGPVVRPHFRD
ncbi:MAG: hypothetical protein S0880_17910 [Actinomycetota bacterium]|nr:hypothetical protein [Actinomycetota bacterium]